MTFEFLALANVCLFTRLVYLAPGELTAPRIWQWKTALEVAAAAALFPLNGLWLGVVVTLLAANVAAWSWERRGRRKDLGRLLLGLGTLAILSVWLSPQLAAKFRPGLRELTFWAQWTALGSLFEALGGYRVQLVLFGLLACANEANLAIRAAFDWLELKPQLPASGEIVVDVKEFNRGRFIGILERVLLFSFLLQAQYGAIGFILAAKAFTRFKALDDRPFAEYVLIGTLLSACLALAMGGVVRWLLAA